jgi:hypothetical protein
MATPPTDDVIVVASAAASVAPAASAAGITTLHAITAASHEHIVGAIVAVGAPAGTAVGA